MFSKRLQQVAGQVERHLDQVMEPLGTMPVIAAMRYAASGGKRLRAFLVLESARLHGIPESQAIWPAAAIEAMHGYSLVHDDLPCMDDDDLRRGQPTVHVKWDQATAVLAGDALQALAFEMLANPATAPSGEIRSALTLGLARAAGARGMVRGQALDMAAETAQTPLKLEEITTLQGGKTGALMIWSATVGPILAEADPMILHQYADRLGLAFQIADDILDVEGDPERAGKRLQKDNQAGKATFVSLLGLEGARNRASELIDMALEGLTAYGPEADGLRAVARFAISRQY